MSFREQLVYAIRFREQLVYAIRYGYHQNMKNILASIIRWC